MPFEPIPASWTQIGRALRVGLMNRIRTNLDDLNTRIDAISIDVGSKELINEMIKADESTPVGTIIPYSSDTLPSGWRFCDGSAVSETDDPELHAVVGANVPDMRGRVVAGRDNMGGVSASRLTSPRINGSTLGAVGGLETVATHTHTMAHTHTVNKNSWNTNQTAHSHSINHLHRIGVVSSGDIYIAADPDNLTANPTSSTGTTKIADLIVNRSTSSGSTGYFSGFNTTSVLRTGGVEVSAAGGTYNTAASGNASVTWSSNTVTTSGVSAANTGSAIGSAQAHGNVQPTIIQNYIIRSRNTIEESPQLLVRRINQPIRVNNVVVSPCNQGSDGTLEIDILKGTSFSGATQTIFTVKPTLEWDDTTSQTGSTDVNQNFLNAGEFLVVSVTDTQANLKSFHLLVSGDI